MTLKERIISVLPVHEECFTNIQGTTLFVRDMKPINGGHATIDSLGGGVAAVELHNPSSLTVDFDAFPKMLCHWVLDYMKSSVSVCCSLKVPMSWNGCFLLRLSM